MNPITNLWGILVRKMHPHGTHITNMGDYEDAIYQKWNQIPIKTLQALHKSMSKRFYNVPLSYGGYTKQKVEKNIDKNWVRV
jgi:hypothetical protein